MRLITRGDDAASCEDANLAMRECVEKGILRNIGVMAIGPALDHAAEVLRDLDVCFGLHFALNSEWESVHFGPVSPRERVPSLLREDGWFTPAPIVLYERGFSVSEATEELRRQLDRVREAGFAVGYLDQHMGIGWIGLKEAIAELCDEEGLVDADARFRHLEVGGGSVEDLLAALETPPADGDPRVFVNHPGIDGPQMRALTLHPSLGTSEPGKVAEERDADRRLWQDPRLQLLVETGKLVPSRYDLRP